MCELLSIQRENFPENFVQDVRAIYIERNDQNGLLAKVDWDKRKSYQGKAFVETVGYMAKCIP